MYTSVSKYMYIFTYIFIERDYFKGMVKLELYQALRSRPAFSLLSLSLSSTHKCKYHPFNISVYYKLA